MPPSHNQRKAAQKKKKAKANKNLGSASRHGENSGGKASKNQNKSPLPAVKVEDNMSGSESSTTENETIETHEVDRLSNSQKQNENSENDPVNNKADFEPGSVADYLSQPLESLIEEGTHKDKNLGVDPPLIADSLNPVDQILVEVASLLNNNTSIEDMKTDLVMAKRPLELNVVDLRVNSPNSATKIDEPTSKENEVDRKPVLLHQKAFKTSKSNVPQDSTNAKYLHFDERIIDPECSVRQPLVDSAPNAAEKTSWKCCCGIFELFSGSNR